MILSMKNCSSKKASGLMGGGGGPTPKALPLDPPLVVENI